LTLLYLVGLLAGIVGLVFGLGYLQLQGSARAAEAAASRVRSDDIEALAREAATVLAERLGGPLPEGPEGLEEAAARLDVLIRSPRVKDAFATPELYWRFVLPLGAALGELLRQHGQARWSDEDSGLVLRVRLPDGQEAAVSPFARVLRHRLSGKPGELRAYVLFAAGRPVERLPPGAPLTRG
jgi:hypothetical protein